MPPSTHGASFSEQQKDKSELLFINKTQNSKVLSNSRSDTSSAKKISQHVQRSRNLEKERKARQERRKAALLRALQSPPGSAPLDPQHNMVYERARSLPTPPESPDDLAGSSMPGYDRENYDGEEIVTPTSLGLMIPARGTVEPFDVVKVHLDNEKYQILQYFVLEFFPAVTRSDTGGFIFGDVSVSRLSALSMVQDSLSHPMHTYALLTGASARMRCLAQAAPPQADLTERFTDTTLRMLRDYISEGREVDHKLLATIYFLWATESYRRNWDGVGTHREMVRYLYNNYLGGFGNLSIHLRKMLWYADRFHASATAEPPIIEESWEAEAISQEELDTITIAIKRTGQVQMGSAFSKYFVYFSERFRRYINELVELASVIQCHWTHVGVQALPDRTWTIGRSFTLSDRLLYLKEARQIEPSSLPAVLQDCVRLAVIVWLAFIPSPRTGVSPPTSIEIKIRAAVDARPLRYRFTALLRIRTQDLPESQQNEMDKLFLWIAGVGALASELEENQTWFIQHFERLAKKLNVVSWSSLASIERSFLWLDRLEAFYDSRLTLLLLAQAFDTH